MRKNYVLDTNVLLHDPQAIFKFEEHVVVIPIHVIEEIDHFKKEMSERGRNARTLARYLDDLRHRSGGSLQKGVKLEKSEGELLVAVPADGFGSPRSNDPSYMDNAIVRTALEIRDRAAGVPTVFVTMDSNLRIRADALGLQAENYEGARIRIDEAFQGLEDITVGEELVNQLGQRSSVALEALELDEAPPANSGLILRSSVSSSHTAVGRYDAREKSVVPLEPMKEGVWGVKPRNLEQRFALAQLLDDRINLVTLLGKAGTGKTLLAVAAGLKKVLDSGTYARLVVSRPIFPLGRDIGYLPGSMEEKLNPWMKPIFDNLEFIFATGRGRMLEGRNYEELVASGTIEIEPLTYIRGRSLPNQYLIVDEAQNLTPHEVKTVITRCGSNTKIVLTGDPNQIDNPYVDAASNGLSVVAERFKGEAIAAHVLMKRGERSELAERATQLL